MARRGWRRSEHAAVRQSWLQRRWPSIRAKGRMRFVLVRGGLVFGGLMTFAMYAMLFFASRRQPLHLQAVAPLVPALCIPAGLLWGLVTWHWNEYLFHKLGFDRDNSFK
jgi:hypothetical protein